MGLLKRKDPWTERYRQVWKQEQAFWKKYEERPATSLEQKLSDAAPEKLLELLHGAFVKAFAAVFDKGEGVISRAGGLPECRRTYQVNDLAAQLWEDRKSLRAFSKEAARRGRGSLLAAGGAGVGLGLLGMVLPDVPLFTAALLKAVYETAESFGFRHEERGEQIYALRVIQASLSWGEDLVRQSRELDTFAQTGQWPEPVDLRQQVSAAAQQLSEAVLGGKLLQNIPVAGAVGGAVDAVCLRRVQRYAAIKYEKRFLLRRRVEKA